MKFYEDQKLLSFEQFSQILPEESNILASALEQEISFSIQGDCLRLISEPFEPLYIDIAKTLEYHKQTFYKRSPYQENLAKALGVKPGFKGSVLDASAGWLADSLLLYAIGVKNLVLCERHPVLASLIVNALKRHPLAVDFRYADSLTLAQQRKFDIIYYDPMYHEVNSKAAPKKEMAVLRQLVGEDLDSLELAGQLKKLCRRLVLKRSQKAHPLLGKPHHTIKGKSTNYDVYI